MYHRKLITQIPLNRKTHMQDLLKELRRTKIQTLKNFDLPASELEKTYAPGKWTVRELLNHIVDAETVLYDRVRRVISSEGRPVIWAFDQDAWCTGLNYKTFPLKINKSLFLATRAGVEYLVKEQYEQLGTKEFIHSESGLRTLRDEFDKIAWHNQHHLRQIEWALEV